MWKFWNHQTWSNKKIAFVAMLIATSVVFVLIFTKIIPITSIPSFKLMAGGLPVKLTGYIFGPLIGAVTGIIVDLVSFAMAPVFIHYWYTIAFMLTGALPGIFAYFMHRRWRNVEAQLPEDAIKVNKLNFYFTIFVLIACIAIMSTVILIAPDETFAKQKLITNKWIFLGISIFGTMTMLVAIVVMRFVVKPKTLNGFTPIVAFSAVLELAAVPLLVLGDMSSLTNGEGFLEIYAGHMLMAPFKIWFNMIIIAFAYRVVAPLIFNKTGNGWDTHKQKDHKIKSSKRLLIKKGSMKKNIYVCGPTVYSKVHIGNIRPILTFDIYIRSLKQLGNDVNFIHNITDIDDKIITRSVKEKTSEQSIADVYSRHYLSILEELNIEKPNSMPRVVDNMPILIKFVEKLVKSGNAYVVDGTVFFDVTSIENYGHLANRKLDEAQYEKEKGKKHPADFALWKKTEVGITFDSPWGKGRPGWHTECAAFVDKELKGKSLDIHGGGIDLIFPHHENEDAQYVALNKVNIANEWKHVGHINIDGEKMSKSLGNVFDAEEFIKNHGADTLRVLFLSKNVTGPLEVTEEVIKNSKDLSNKYLKAFMSSKLVSKNEKAKMDKIDKIAQFISEWDFNSAFVEYNQIVKDYNKNHDTTTANYVIAASKLLGFSFANRDVSDKQRQMYDEYLKLKESKKFEESDRLRELLIKDGLI